MEKKKYEIVDEEQTILSQSIYNLDGFTARLM
jgi:hypothetical protein